MWQAVWNGGVIATSDQTVEVEGNQYFPMDSINKELITDSTQTSVCPWKGEANYFNVVFNGEINMAYVCSADPRINQLGLVTLSDPEGLLLSFNLVPIASEALDQGVCDAVNAVSSSMSAEDWLRSEGLIE